MESFDWALDAYRGGEVFTAFDIETTGLDPVRDRIVEIGAVKFDRRGILCRYSALINPGVAMPEEAGRVNHISDGMLAGKPPVEQILPDFLRFVKNTVIAAHNAPFDCGFVNEALKTAWSRGGGAGLFPAGGAWKPPFPALPNRIADTLLLARRLLAGRKSYKLQDLAAALGVAAIDAHRAEDDARLCMEVFVALCG